MLIKSIEDVLALFGSNNLYVERNPFNADRYYQFDPEQDYQHDIKLLKFHLKELKKILKDIRRHLQFLRLCWGKPNSLK